MSRCGSTLVSQMLAASAANLVVAEAPPIDQVIRLGGGPDQTAERLRAIVAAIAQPRCGEQRTNAYGYGERHALGDEHKRVIVAW